jgi:hypothetical protein
MPSVVGMFFPSPGLVDAGAGTTGADGAGGGTAAAARTIPELPPIIVGRLTDDDGEGFIDGIFAATGT